MSALALPVGVLVALSAAAVVYADATRRRAPATVRLGWTLGVAAAGLGVTALRYVVADELHRLYLTLFKPRPVVASPLELLAVDLVVTVSLASLPLCAYVAGRRVGD